MPVFINLLINALCMVLSEAASLITLFPHVCTSIVGVLSEKLVYMRCLLADDASSVFVNWPQITANCIACSVQRQPHHVGMSCFACVICVVCVCGA